MLLHHSICVFLGIFVRNGTFEVEQRRYIIILFEFLFVKKINLMLLGMK